MAEWHLPFTAYDAGIRAGPDPWHVGLAHGTMTLELYRPVGEDTQTPHRRDEIYIIRAGSARFHRGDAVVSVGAGDTLFVPAGMPHRFSSMSADFDTWVVFWGPDGGERSESHAD